MKKLEHPIRNGIIATVIGGIILSFWPWYRNIISDSLNIIWNSIKYIWSFMTGSYEIPVWIMLLFGLVVVFNLYKIVKYIQKNTRIAPHYSYKKDNIFGIEWHWNYKNGGIVNLWCLCPTCKSELVYYEHKWKPENLVPFFEPKYTKLICEKCNKELARFDGELNDTLGTVEREIRRKIRTGEWDNNIYENLNSSK